MSESGASSPRDEYTRRLGEHRAAGAKLARLQRRLADARLAAFLVGAALVWLAAGAQRIGAGWVVVPVVLFAGLVIWSTRVDRSKRRADRAASFYERGLARLEDRWAGGGQAGERYLDKAHPYAADLDLFGAGSVFELLSTARTRSGEDTLAAWLRAPAPPEEIRARQEAVAELRPRLDLREDFALLGADVPSGVDLDGLVAWGEAPPGLTSRPARLAASLLAAATLAALAAWALGGPRDPFLAALILEALLFLRLRDRVGHVLAPVERRADDLALFAGLLARLEREPFRAPRLGRLREAIGAEGLPASRQIRRLVRLIDWLNARRNLLFAPLALILLWGTQLAFAIERWRAASGRSIGRWLAALGEIEALCALAAYAYEHPTDPFPEITPDGPRFEASGLGHPLIPEARSVRNDVHLGDELRVLVVSGSNMSGKSTLLRAIGVNAVLAQAGAPVRAARLRLSPLAPGATLRIEDSLQAGQSRFFAEIVRIRQLVDLAGGSPPLLFLLDEIFHGTNSADRRLGAEAVVRGLIDRGAIGLVTTHDLALAEIAERLAPRSANVHFEDQFEDGAMTFDYRMRPGVVRHSNALALMRAVGLEV